jgi:radical SAM protein with 4Fe4S-binding SPASM domain
MNSIIATGRAPESGLELSQSELELALTEVTAAAEDLGLRFTWYSPTRYCELNPLQFGLGPKRCTAAEYNICIEPDGQVLPCQSYFETAGNILRDSWETIWNGELFQSIRSRTKRDEPCVGCPDFDVCGGGCPLSAGTSFVCSSGMSEG